jgi:hypothetical protein
MSDKDWEEAMESRIQASRQQVIEASTTIQARKEKVMKRKALARWMFGRFHLRVPRFTEQLFTHVPLPSSFSEPFDPKTYPSIQIRERVYGQHFHGDMIPKREVQIDSSHTIRARENVFIRAGLERYFDDAFGWATFLNVAKVSYFVGAGMAKGRVFAKKNGLDAQLVGHSTLFMASAGIGSTVTSVIIFFSRSRCLPTILQKQLRT